MEFKKLFHGYEEDDLKRIRVGNMNVADPSILLRSQKTPKNVMVVIGIAVVIASVVGGCVGFNAIDSVVHGEQKRLAAVEDNLTRDVSLDLPLVADLISLDDASIRQTFSDAGLTCVDMGEQKRDEGLDVFKLPSDVSVSEAGAALAGGVSGLDAATAAKLFKGGWRFTCTRDDYIDMRVKYADFSASDSDAAISGALATEGWVVGGEPAGNVVLGESGVDESGNTFQEGTVTNDNGTYQWRVSTCQFKYIYDISGLPENAMYVVVRITA